MKSMTKLSEAPIEPRSHRTGSSPLSITWWEPQPPLLWHRQNKSDTSGYLWRPWSPKVVQRFMHHPQLSGQNMKRSLSAQYSHGNDPSDVLLTKLAAAIGQADIFVSKALVLQFLLPNLICMPLTQQWEALYRQGTTLGARRSRISHFCPTIKYGIRVHSLLGLASDSRFPCQKTKKKKRIKRRWGDLLICSKSPNATRKCILLY